MIFGHECNQRQLCPNEAFQIIEKKALNEEAVRGPAFGGGTLPPPLELDDPWRQTNTSDSDTTRPSRKSPGPGECLGWIRTGEVMRFGGKRKK